MDKTYLILDRKAFYTKIRPMFGTISIAQVAGINAILNEYEARRNVPVRHLAYILATAYHETNKTMQPIEEYGRGKGKPYGAIINGIRYYGRGLVQLTWLTNYARFSKLLKLDLVNNPELALRMDVSVKILFEGMINGLFTGKSLSDYTSFKDMRRIINGTDKAELIAGYADGFLRALQ